MVIGTPYTDVSRENCFEENSGLLTLLQKCKTKQINYLSSNEMRKVAFASRMTLLDRSDF